MENEIFIAQMFATTWVKLVNAVNMDRIKRGLEPWSEDEASKMFVTLMAAPKE